jgi:protein-tyrosine phosphatase
MNNKKIRILFVCYGNICRSPSAEAIVSQKLNASSLSGSVSTDSAGTADFHIGKQPDKRAISTGVSRGYDNIQNLRARQLEWDDMEVFDLILIMDDKNAKNVAEIFECHSPKVEYFHRYLSDESLTHIADPFHGEQEDFEQMFDVLEQAADGLILMLENKNG